MIKRSNFVCAVIACVVICCAAGVNACNTVTCQSLGGSCASNSSNSVHCNDGSICSSGICVVGSANGQTCSSNNNCTSLQCNSVTSLCAAYITGPGGACSTNSECIFTNSTSTIAVCQNGACYGIPHGGACDVVGSVSECVGTDYCNSNNVCATKISPGGSCGPSDQCTGYSFCSSGQCAVRGSIAEQSQCTSTAYCGDNDYCSTQTNLCSPGIVISRDKCNLDTQCQASTCQCNTDTGYGMCTAQYSNPTGYSSLVSALARCVASSGCPDEQCYKSRCKSQYCAYQSFEIGANRNQYSLTEASCQVADFVSVQQKAMSAYCTAGAQKIGLGGLILAFVMTLALL